MDKNYNSVIPFCIYNIIDEYTSTYMGYIGVPQRVKLNDGSEVFRCTPGPGNSSMETSWYVLRCEPRDTSYTSGNADFLCTTQARLSIRYNRC